MNLITILIIIFTIFFLGYPLVFRVGKKSEVDLKKIDEYIEREVHTLRSPLPEVRGETRKRKVSPGEPRTSEILERDLFCPSCGRKYSTEESFCTNCGTKLKFKTD